MVVFRKIGTAHSSKNPPLVFLHGWGGDWRSWFPIIEHLKKSYTIYALDLPGFGAAPLFHPYTLDDYTKDVLQFLTKEKLKTVVLIGHSLGGGIAAKIAAQAPERVRKLVLVDASGIRSHPSISKRALAAVATTGKTVLSFPGLSSVYPKVRAWFYTIGSLKDSDYAAPMSDQLRQTLVNILRDDISEDLVRITCKTLLIWGDQDKETPLWQGERMAALINGSRLEVIRGGDHFAYLNHQETFINFLIPFLKES